MPKTVTLEDADLSVVSVTLDLGTRAPGGHLTVRYALHSKTRRLTIGEIEDGWNEEVRDTALRLVTKLEENLAALYEPAKKETKDADQLREPSGIRGGLRTDLGSGRTPTEQL